LVLIQYQIFFQSLEMTQRELYLRRLSRLSTIPLWRIKLGYGYYRNSQQPDYRKLLNGGAGEISNTENNVFVNDTSGLTPQEIALNTRVAYEHHGIDIFVLDHFHRLNFSGKYKEMRHAQEQGLEIILAACKNSGITPVILAQLNRGIENTETEREPRLSDLRDVGRLEEAATNVLFVYWKYKRTQKEEDKYAIKILNAKARDGHTGRIFLEYSPEIYHFGNTINGAY